MSWEDDIYNAQKAAAEEAFAQKKALAGENLRLGQDTVNRQADWAIGQQNKASDSALQGAYIGWQQDQRNMGQRLASLGYNGGASETSLLGLTNAYRSNRAGLEKERMRNNSQTELQRQSDLANLQMSYNDALAGGYGDFANRMASAQESAYNRYYTRQQDAAKAATASASAGSKSGGSSKSGGGNDGGYTMANDAYWRQLYNGMQRTSGERVTADQAQSDIYNRLRAQGYTSAQAEALLKRIGAM